MIFSSIGSLLYFLTLCRLRITVIPRFTVPPIGLMVGGGHSSGKKPWKKGPRIPGRGRGRQKSPPIICTMLLKPWRMTTFGSIPRKGKMKMK